MKNYTYDIETYPNLFCVVFNTEDNETVFEISARRNDYDELVEFYRPENIKYAIGFNNLKFDSQVLHWLVTNESEFKNKQGSEIVGLIFEKSQQIIDSQRDGGFPPYAEWHIRVTQIDLYLINHYNNKDKMTS